MARNFTEVQLQKSRGWILPTFISPWKKFAEKATTGQEHRTGSIHCLRNSNDVPSRKKGSGHTWAQMRPAPQRLRDHTRAEVRTLESAAVLGYVL